MKNYTINILVLLIFMCSVVFAQENKNPVALVQKVVKTVDYKTEELDWQEAKPGIPLLNGNEVRTGAKSLAIVKFLDGSLVRVRENTTLNIYGESSNGKQQTNTVLAGGEINFEVNKQEEDEFTFTTPTGIASIRGTSGNIEVPDQQNTIFILETGAIELEATQGSKSSARLTAGNTAQVGNNGEIDIKTSSEADKAKLKRAKLTKIKKLKFETEEGVYEIEYLDQENN